MSERTDNPPSAGGRSAIERLLDAIDLQHAERLTEQRLLRAAIEAHNADAPARHAETQQMIAELWSRSPGRWEFRALGTALIMVLIFVLVLYAQGRGQNVGAAVDATRALVAPAAASASDVPAPDPQPPDPFTGGPTP